MRQRVWLVTGVRTGLGRALAQAMLDAGDAVVGTTRDGTSDLQSDAFHVLPLDVTDASAIPAAVAQAHAWRGHIDVVVNNAGSGVFGSVEETSDGDVLDAFDLNFHGPRRILQAVLPFMRAQGDGQIVNVASIAATDPLAGSAIYAAAKAALLAMSEGLSAELEPFGIKVTAVLPGAFRTAFLDHPERLAAAATSPYSATVGAALKHFAERAGKQPGDPARAARAILDAVNSDRPPLYLLLGEDAVRRTRARLERVRADIDLWEPTSAGTGFHDDASVR